MSMISFSMVVGVLALVVGFLLLFAPKLLSTLNELSARMIARIDSLTFSYRVGFGISLIIISMFMFFMAYYFTKRH